MRHLQLHWIVFLAVTSGIALGQSNAVIPVTPVHPAADYSAEPLVIERVEHIYTFAADGTGSTRESIVARVQSDATVRQLGVLTIPFASASQHVEIGYVRVRRPDGTVTETPASQAIEIPSPVTTEAPFYSDLKQLQVPVRNLRVGDKLEWQATIDRTKAEAPGEFWGEDNFIADAVVLSQVIEVRAPLSKHIVVWSPGKVPAVRQEGEERIFRWESPQFKPTVGKEADAEKESKKKHVLTEAEELDEEQGKIPDISWTSFASWDAVGNWYRTLESDRVTPDAEVKSKVAELIAGKTSEEEKVRAVYSYVATQIRYVGVAFGIGRYQPHKASDVLENQYGDCKDKHTLLAAMLTELGLHPSAVLIGAGIRFNESVPSPAAFNHVITTVPVGGKQIWLDATAEVAPYQALQYPIRDKQALVIPESGAAAIERTPEKLPFDSFEKLDAAGSLNTEGISDSHIVMTLRGDGEMFLRSAFRSTSPAQYDELMQRVSQGMRYAGTVSHTEVSHLDDTREPLQLAYEYKREKAGDWDNRRIIPQLAPVQLPWFTDTEPPTQSIVLGVPYVETSTSAMKLPEGWGAQLPEAVHQKCEYVSYDQTYRLDKGTVYAERRIEIFKRKVPLADYKSYKKFTDAVDLGNETYIQLTNTSVKKPVTAGNEKKESKASTTPAFTWVKPATEATAKAGTATAVPAVPSGPSTIPSNAEAAKLIQSAYRSLERREVENVQAQLDSAKAINPEQAWLWTTYGYLDMARFQLPEAIADFQKEILLHPDTYQAYAPLAQAQGMFNHQDEARQTLRNWAAAQPENPQPTSMLTTMLLEEDDAESALTAAEAGIAHLPADKKNDEHLQFLLGRAQRRAGQPEKCAATLAALLRTTSDAELLRSAASELAESGKELPLAESSARDGLAKLEAESKTWTLDENADLLVSKSGQIAATWDTIGLILFREDKLEEAENFARAAWINHPSLETGKHLGEIEEARGNIREALETYQVAIQTEPHYDMMGVRKQPSLLEKELMGRVQAEWKSNTHANGIIKLPQLQQLRTVPLGAAKGLNGTAEYRLLLSRGKVVKVENFGDKTLTGGNDRVQKAEFPDYFPSGSQVQLVRMAILNCHSKVCELVLEPWPAKRF